MSAATRLVLLSVALIPYAALAGFDAWMHEKSRRVPPLEKFLHAIAALTFAGFVVGVFRDMTTLAAASLCLFLVVSAWDEAGFHADLAARERRVHFAAYGALSVFVAAWVMTGGLA